MQPHKFVDKEGLTLLNPIVDMPMAVDRLQAANAALFRTKSHYVGLSPLHTAVRHASLEVVERLIKHCASKSATDHENQSPVVYLCADCEGWSNGDQRTIENRLKILDHLLACYEGPPPACFQHIESWKNGATKNNALQILNGKGLTPLAKKAGIVAGVATAGLSGAALVVSVPVFMLPAAYAAGVGAVSSVEAGIVSLATTAYSYGWYGAGAGALALFAAGQNEPEERRRWPFRRR
jgi:hypothetical protein